MDRNAERESDRVLASAHGTHGVWAPRSTDMPSTYRHRSADANLTDMKTRTTETPAAFDTKSFRNALGMFATGITIITTRTSDGKYAGLTVNSFNSVSLDPPLVLWSLALSSTQTASFLACESYAINVLSRAQLELSKCFATSGIEKFSGVAFEEGIGSAPFFADSCAVFECRNERRHAAGDHVIFIGRVERFRRNEAEPLVFHSGRFRGLGAV